MCLDAQLPAEDAPDPGGKLRPPIRSDHRWYAESGRPGGDECVRAGRRRHVPHGGAPQGHDRLPLPISSDFFSTFIDVSGSGPRSLIKC